MASTCDRQARSGSVSQRGRNSGHVIDEWLIRIRQRKSREKLPESSKAAEAILAERFAALHPQSPLGKASSGCAPTYCAEDHLFSASFLAMGEPEPMGYGELRHTEPELCQIDIAYVLVPIAGRRCAAVIACATSEGGVPWRNQALGIASPNKPDWSRVGAMIARHSSGIQYALEDGDLPKEGLAGETVWRSDARVFAVGCVDAELAQLTLDNTPSRLLRKLWKAGWQHGPVDDLTAVEQALQ